MSKIKITESGQPCNKCGCPVEKRIRPNTKVKPNQNYYFEYWFYCPECHTNYMVESAKVYIKNAPVVKKPKNCDCRNIETIRIETLNEKLCTFECCADCGKTVFKGVI